MSANDEPISIDFETGSPVDLKTAGIHNYVRHSETRVWCMAYECPYNIDPNTGQRLVAIWGSSAPFPLTLVTFLRNGGKLRGWNFGGFEYHVWNAFLAGMALPTSQGGGTVPRLTTSMFEDTMTAALAMGLPGSLEQAAKALRLNVTKDMGGHRLMMSCAKPMKRHGTGSPYWKVDHDPDARRRLYAYCKTDVKVERAIAQRVPRLTDSELVVYDATHQMNERGVKVDMGLAYGARRIVEQRVDKLNSQLFVLTHGEVSSATAVASLRRWIQNELQLDEPLQSLDKNAVSGLVKTLEKGDMTKQAGSVLAALNIRREVGKSSTAKLKAMVNRAGADARVRGMFRHNGAGSTGRFSSTGIQLQNLYRKVIKPLEPGVALMKSGDLDAVEMFYPNVMEAVSSCLRPCFIADDGKIFHVFDWSSIEGILCFWLVDDRVQIKAYAEGRDMYQVMGAAMYHRQEQDIVGDLRQSSKCATLACSFAGGVGALTSMNEIYGVVMSEQEKQDTVERFRAANPKLVAGWNTLMDAIWEANRNHGKVVNTGLKNIAYAHDGQHLWARLPSGRRICYPWCRQGMVSVPWDDQLVPGIVYEGRDAYTNQWVERSLHRGIAIENKIQAIAADLMRSMLVRITRKNQATRPNYDFRPVMTIHDELAIESPDDERNEERAREIKQMMVTPPPWATDLPLRAEGYTSKRFQKG